MCEGCRRANIFLDVASLPGDRLLCCVMAAALRTLLLSTNALHGTLPSTVTLMKNLTYVLVQAGAAWCEVLAHHVQVMTSRKTPKADRYPPQDSEQRRYAMPVI